MHSPIGSLVSATVGARALRKQMNPMIYPGDTVADKYRTRCNPLVLR